MCYGMSSLTQQPALNFRVPGIVRPSPSMMAHDDEARSNHFGGKPPDEIQPKQQMMDAHVRRMIADQN